MPWAGSDMYLIHHAYLGNDDLEALYNKLVEQDLHQAVFYAGQHQKAESWARYVRERCWAVCIKSDAGIPLAVFWLDGFSGKTAFIHFWIYRGAWRKSNELAKQAIKYIKECLGDRLTGVIGKTPASNKAAVAFAIRNGFKELCRVPDACPVMGGGTSDAVITYREI